MTDKLLRFHDALADNQQLMEYFDHDDWQQLLAYAEHRTFSADEILVDAGDSARLMFIVVEGTLNVVVDEGAGTDKRIDTIEAPSVFGEQTFLDGLPRSARIAAQTDGAAYCLRIEGLQAMVREKPGLAAIFLYDLARVISLRFRAWQ